MLIDSPQYEDKKTDEGETDNQNSKETKGRKVLKLHEQNADDLMKTLEKYQ